jgi:hypothetical protein
LFDVLTKTGAPHEIYCLYWLINMYDKNIYSSGLLL